MTKRCTKFLSPAQAFSCEYYFQKYDRLFSVNDSPVSNKAYSSAVIGLEFQSAYFSFSE